MYLKVTMGSLLFSGLFDIINGERERNNQFREWQVKNLPEFNNDVLTHRSPWYMYADVVAWKFAGEVDTKTWQEIKGWKGYYEPNKRTKAGKAMRERIYEARGERFNRMEFFDMFGTSMPVPGQFTVPNGFVYDGVCYMVFDDANYKDISTKMAGQFEEITLGEWKAAADAYNEANKKK
jgi:hypothetical protein